MLQARIGGVAHDPFGVFGKAAGADDGNAADGCDSHAFSRGMAMGGRTGMTGLLRDRSSGLLAIGGPFLVRASPPSFAPAPQYAPLRGTTAAAASTTASAPDAPAASQSNARTVTEILLWHWPPQARRNRRRNSAVVRPIARLEVLGGGGTDLSRMTTTMTNAPPSSSSPIA